MKAEISNHGYRNENRYSGIYLQQGSMITDRDWNAAVNRLKAGYVASTSLATGSGVPRHHGLFDSFSEEDATNHIWSATFKAAGGWVTAGGITALALPGDTDTAFSYGNQADLPNPPKLMYEFLYADIWEETVTAHDEPDLADPGLHGAHTAFASRLRVQIKQCTKEQRVETPCGLQPNDDLLPSIGDAALSLVSRSGNAGKDNCDPCAAEVDLDLDSGNALFRAEVHNVDYDTSGVPVRVVLKWSADNGAIRHVRPADANELPTGHALEFFNNSHGSLMGLPAGGPQHQPERGALFHDMAGFSSADAKYTHVREWDGYAEIDLTGGNFVRGWDQGVDLAPGGNANDHGSVVFGASGISIGLSRFVLTLDVNNPAHSKKIAAILTGDYWLAVMRSRADEAHRIKVLSPTPIGIRHHYCMLGSSKDGKSLSAVSPADKRRLSFPELTCLNAADSAFSPPCNTSVFNSPEAARVTTVAEALRLLCSVNAVQILYNTSCSYLKGTTNVQQALDKLCARNYWALRMSAGTGQEGYAGDTLASPIEVYVEDQDGKPVKGAEVLFETVAPAGSGDKLVDATNAGHSGDVLKITTDADGYAYVFWILGEGTGVHSVSVKLTKPPQGTSATLWYTATLKERKVASNHATVWALRWMPDKDFFNDTAYDATTYEEGFFIQLSDKVLSEHLVSNDVLVVTAEVPRGGLIQELILCGDTLAKEDKIHFVPRKKIADNLLEGWPPKDMPECAPAEGLRIRIRLLGRFVRTHSGLLDGFVPGDYKDKFIDLDFANAGLGHASDFEAWFYLAPAIKEKKAKDWIIDEIKAIGIVDNVRAGIVLDAIKNAASIDDVIKRPDLNPKERDILVNKKNLFLFGGGN